MGIGYRYGGDKGRIGREYVFDVWRGGRGLVKSTCSGGERCWRFERIFVSSRREVTFIKPKGYSYEREGCERDKADGQSALGKLFRRGEEFPYDAGDV